jgi:acyl-CoA thioesterase
MPDAAAVRDIEGRPVSGFCESAVPIFTREGKTLWRPREEARGPFDGLQGGCIAGLLCAAAEEQVGAGFHPRSIATFFLRPVPLAQLEVAVHQVQKTRRSAVLEASLSIGEKLCARAIITFTSDVVVAAVPEVAMEPNDPAGMAAQRLASPHGLPWLMDVMETRMAQNDRVWFRLAAPITGNESRFAKALPALDFMSGISRPDTWSKPIVKAFPNTDLTVHIDRMPVSDWIGLAASGSWRRTGNGRAAGRVFDVEGEIGSANYTVVLVP